MRFGSPERSACQSTRRIIKGMSEEWDLPVVVTDADVVIQNFLTIAFGAIKTAHISEYLATLVRPIGCTSDDILAYDLPSTNYQTRYSRLNHKKRP